jgi:hypothetical protein
LPCAAGDTPTTTRTTPSLHHHLLFTATPRLLFRICRFGRVSVFATDRQFSKKPNWMENLPTYIEFSGNGKKATIMNPAQAQYARHKKSVRFTWPKKRNRHSSFYKKNQPNKPATRAEPSRTSGPTHFRAGVSFLPQYSQTLPAGSPPAFVPAPLLRSPAKTHAQQAEQRGARRRWRRRKRRRAGCSAYGAR